jgi:putative chitobiose transport system substrate-binding protein
MLRRRSLLRVSAAPLAALALPAPAQAARELVLWTMQLSPFHDTFVHGLLRSFEARHRRWRVRWVDVPWAEMERKVLASVAAGTAPDVVNLNPQFAARLAELGALRDPRPFLTTAEQRSYLAPAWAANTFAGVPFGLPWYLSTTLTLAHRGVLARAGLAQAPQDYDAVIPAARALRDSTGGYAWFAPLDGSAPLEAMVAMAGPLLSPDGCVAAFAGARGEAVFAWYRQLLAERLIPPSTLTEGHRAAVALFAAGQVAMLNTGMQFLTHIAKANPALYAQIEVQPQWTSANGDARANIAAMNLAVPAASGDAEGAFRLAAHITNADNQLALVKRVPLLPSSAASLDDALFTAASGDALLDRARAISVAQVRGGHVAVPPMRRYSKLRIAHLRGLQSAMLGRQTPAAAVAEVSSAWRALLGCDLKGRA